MLINKRNFILSKFISDNLSFLSSLASLQTPEDLACSGKHEAVKVLKEYAEVCGSVVMKGCVLNLDAFLSHSQSIALCLMLITHFLSLSPLLFLSLSLLILHPLSLCIESFLIFVLLFYLFTYLFFSIIISFLLLSND